MVSIYVKKSWQYLLYLPSCKNFHCSRLIRLLLPFTHITINDIVFLPLHGICSQSLVRFPVQFINGLTFFPRAYTCHLIMSFNCEANFLFLEAMMEWEKLGVRRLIKVPASSLWSWDEWIAEKRLTFTFIVFA